MESCIDQTKPIKKSNFQRVYCFLRNNNKRNLPFLILILQNNTDENNIKKKFGTICSSKVTSKIGGKRADWISVSAIWRISSLTFLCSFKLRWAKRIKLTAKDDKMAHNSRTRARYHQVKIYGSVCKGRKGGHTTNYIPLLWCVMDWKWKCDREQWENTRVTYLSVDCVVFAWEVEWFLFYRT